MRFLRKWLILLHRYLSIALCLLFVVWFVSGIAMIYAGGMPELTAGERLARMPAVDLAKVRVTVLEAASEVGLGPHVDRAVLTTIMDRPAYRFFGKGFATVFADSGELLGEISEPQSLTIARRFLNVPAPTVRHVRVLETADQWTISQQRQAPLHRIAVDDAAGTELYVSEQLGEVVMQTTRRTRALAWVAAIPHWLYFAPLRMRSELWTRVIEWTSGLGIVAALLGLVLGIIQFRVKYAGWMRWHYLTGVVFGLFTLTWVFSGFLSVEPVGWFSGSDRAAGLREALSGGPLDLAAFGPVDPERWARAMGGRQAKEIEFRRVQGKPYYFVRASDPAMARSARPAPLLVAADGLQPRREPFSVESLLGRLREGYSSASIEDAQVLADYDAYYYDRNRVGPLPVLRAKFADPERTWVYVAMTSGELVRRFSRRQRLERWLYHGFHSLDFPFLYYNRPLWDIAVILLCSGGAALSSIGVVIGFRRVRRDLGLKPSRP